MTVANGSMNGRALHPTEGTGTLPARLFDPHEVATIIDAIPPVTPARMDWPHATVVITMVAVLCAAGAAALNVNLYSVRPVEPQPVHAPVIASPAARVPPVQPSPVRPSTVIARAVPDVQGPPPSPRPAVARVTSPRRQDARGTLVTLNQKAMAAFERRAYGQSMRLLSQGVQLCRYPTLAWQAVCARTHLNLGAVLEGGFGQSGLASKHFRIARAIRGR